MSHASRSIAFRLLRGWVGARDNLPGNFARLHGYLHFEMPIGRGFLTLPIVPARPSTYT